jgi:hypothetical protein
MESIQIYLNSKDASKYNNNSLSDCQFILPNIEIPDGYHIYLSINHATIPYSFYNVNLMNNYLSYICDTITYDLTFPVGNYNLNQIISYLNTNLINITVSYSNITNKITFTSLYNIQLQSISTCFNLLGFIDGLTYNSNSLPLTSNKSIDLVYTKYILIDTNFTTYNILFSQPNNNSILCMVPVSSYPFSLIQYTNTNNFNQ